MPKIEKLVVFAARGFAVPALDALAEAGRTPELILTQPPRAIQDEEEPPSHPALVEWAEGHGVELLAPRRLDEGEVLERLGALEPDLGLAIAYGQAVPSEVLGLPKRGCVHVHPSLLPKMRGSAPIRGALSNGDSKTGVTAILMEEKAHSGPILFQEELEISEEETYGELYPRLATLAAELTVETLAKLEKTKKLKSRKQNEKASTRSPRADDRHRKAPWALDANDVFNRLRAYAPRPGLSAFIRLRSVQILWGKPLGWVQAPYGESGTYLGMRQGRLAVLCGDNTVFGIETLQRPDGEPQSAGDFARAEKLRVGDHFI